MKKLIIPFFLFIAMFSLPGCGKTKIKEALIPQLDMDIGINTVSRNERGILKIAAPQAKKSFLITESIRIFEERNPGWIVQYESEDKMYLEQVYGDLEHERGGGLYIWRDDEEALERYYKNLPDKLRTENGPDIVLLKHADRERLINERLLEDLMQLIAVDEKTAF